jgi:hypothetical protein
MFFAVNRLSVSIQSMFFLPSVPNYAPDLAATSYLDFKWQWRRQDNLATSLFIEFHHSELIYVAELAGPSLYQGSLKTKQRGGGCPNYQQKRGCRCLSVVDGPLQKVFPNQPWLWLKKSQNNGDFKIIRIGVIHHEHSIPPHLVLYVQ